MSKNKKGFDILNSKERKAERLNSNINDTMSVKHYNLALGLCICYGLIANALLVLFATDFMMTIDPFFFLIAYFICAVAGILISSKSKNPYVSFIGYNLICVPIGLLLSISLTDYDASLIFSAALATGIVTALMIAASQIFPDFFAKLGKVLLFSLLAMIIVEIIFLFAGLSTGWIDFVAVGIFSLYIGFDFHVAQRYPKTLDNAVDSAIDLYLDIINLFLRILSIMSKSRD